MNARKCTCCHRATANQATNLGVPYARSCWLKFYGAKRNEHPTLADCVLAFFGTLVAKLPTGTEVTPLEPRPTCLDCSSPATVNGRCVYCDRRVNSGVERAL